MIAQTLGHELKKSEALLKHKFVIYVCVCYIMTVCLYIHSVCASALLCSHVTSSISSCPSSFPALSAAWTLLYGSVVRVEKTHTDVGKTPPPDISLFVTIVSHFLRPFHRHQRCVGMVV